MQRVLIYVLFVVVVAYFLALRYEKLETKTLWQGPIRALSGDSWGEIQLKRRSDGSEVLIIRLKARVPEPVIVLVRLRSHLDFEVGRFKEASFIITLPKKVKASEIKAVQLVSVQKGRILAEAHIGSAAVSSK